MTGTVRLNVPLIAEAQSSKYVTHNDALQALEDAFEGSLSVSVSSANQTLTDAQFRASKLFRISGASVAGRTVTLPSAIERLVFVSLDSVSTQTVDVKIGSNTVTVSPDTAVLIRTDGSGNLAKIMQSVTGTIPTVAEAKAETLVIAVGDETTAITTGTAKVTFRMPWAMTVLAVRASLTTVSSSGIPTIDINEAGTTILSTKLTIDASEKTSTTAATAAVISDASLADDAEITIDIDVAGTGAAGLKVYIIGTRA